MLTLTDIEALFLQKGHEQYSGEPVTQLQHALQTAALAEAEGADDALVTAALLHDLGHLVQDLGDTPSLRGVDDLHQFIAIPFLRGLLPSRVSRLSETWLFRCGPFASATLRGTVPSADVAVQPRARL